MSSRPTPPTTGPSSTTLECASGSVYLLDAEGVATGAGAAGWLAAAASHLTAEEAARCDRYLFPEKRVEFILGRVLVRSVLRELHGIDAPDLAITDAGKLYLAGRPAGPFFNLSHSHGALALIVSADREVGIDIERIRPVSPELARGTMHPEERASFRSEEDFFRCWTAKEAYMKLRGAGLAIPPLALRVSLEARVVTEIATGNEAPFAAVVRGAHVATWLAAPAPAAASS
jgi:phosphopantetheinyl transferase